MNGILVKEDAVASSFLYAYSQKIFICYLKIKTESYNMILKTIL